MKNQFSECVQRARRLRFDARPTGIHYGIPFPLGVFGTLRIIPENQGNAGFMFEKEPKLHCKGFLPHFQTEGLALRFEEGASAVLEVFFYDRADWSEIIKTTDMLEGFDPEGLRGYYVRTLMEVRLLPDDFAHELFELGLERRNRSLGIPEEKWTDYPSVPAWVYSNEESNMVRAQRSGYTTPVIWWQP